MNVNISKNLKEVIIETNKGLVKKKIPHEIRKLILLQSFNVEKIAEECDKDPDFLDICKLYKQTLCKDILLKYGYEKNIENYKGLYCEVLSKFIKVIQNINYKKVELKDAYIILDNIEKINDKDIYSLIFENKINILIKNILYYFDDKNYVSKYYDVDEIFISKTWKNLQDKDKKYIVHTVIKSLKDNKNQHIYGLILNFYKVKFDIYMLADELIKYKMYNVLNDLCVQGNIEKIEKQKLYKYILEKAIYSNNIEFFDIIIKGYTSYNHISKLEYFVYLLTLIKLYNRKDFETLLEKHLILPRDRKKSNDMYNKIISKYNENKNENTDDISTQPLSFLQKLYAESTESTGSA